MTRSIERFPSESTTQHLPQTAKQSSLPAGLLHSTVCDRVRASGHSPPIGRGLRGGLMLSSMRLNGSRLALNFFG